MGTLTDNPSITFAATLLMLALAAVLGMWLAAHYPAGEEDRGHLSQITGAALSIMALLIGFSFSAAINRYDLRKNFEQEEASAISTEYSLAGLLPAADAAQLRTQLARYIGLRVAYYEAGDINDIPAIRAQREQLENEMWAIVQRDALAQQTPIIAQVVAGLNQVTSRPSYSQAAALDRIPGAAWTLLVSLAFFCCALLGYSAQGRKARVLQFVVPVFVALCFYFIANLDSQRRGLIRVLPENLIRTAQSLKGMEKQGAMEQGTEGQGEQQKQ